MICYRELRPGGPVPGPRHDGDLARGLGRVVSLRLQLLDPVTLDEAHLDGGKDLQNIYRQF